MDEHAAGVLTFAIFCIAITIIIGVAIVLHPPETNCSEHQNMTVIDMNTQQHLWFKEDYSSGIIWVSIPPVTISAPHNTYEYGVYCIWNCSLPQSVIDCRLKRLGNCSIPEECVATCGGY